MEDESTKTTLVTKKIRIYPNNEQIKLLQKCFRGHRYVYNKSVEDYKTYKNKSFQTIRNRILTNDRDMDESHPEHWLSSIPKDTRVEAIRCFNKNVNVCIENKKRGHIKSFDMKFRSKKYNDDICIVNKNAVKWKNNKFELFSTRLRTNKYVHIKNSKHRKWLQNNMSSFCNVHTGILSHFCSIIRTKGGSYYLLISYDKRNEFQNHKRDIVGLDPGVRTFQTFYGLNECGKLGDKYSYRVLDKLHKRIDKMQSVHDTLNVKHMKYKLRKRCNKLRTKVKNIVSDLHWKAASFLTKTYKVILLPTFNTKQMVERKLKKRKITKKVVRNMMALSHFTFKTKIKHLAKRYGSTVIECSEAYTSKTCGVCGNINNKLGSKDVYECSKCNSTIDRDMNGARNVLIRSLTTYIKAQ